MDLHDQDNDDDFKELRSEIRVRNLGLAASGLIQQCGQLWQVYQELFNSVNLDDPENHELAIGAIGEMEYNLISLLDEVTGHLAYLEGYFEPIPVDEVEDFEASVLTSLANLDTIDLEDYRVDEIKDIDKDEVNG